MPELPLTGTALDWLRENRDLLNYGSFHNLYYQAQQWLDMYDIGRLTDMLITTKFDPLKGMTYIPKYFLTGSKQDKFTIPDYIKTINECAFEESELQSIIIPKTVKEIRKEAFANSEELIGVIFQDGITTIPEGCFIGCDKLSIIVFPKTLKRIEDRAFLWCYGLHKVDLPEGLEYIGENAFQCAGDEVITLPKSLVDIADSALDNNFSITVKVYHNTVGEEYAKAHNINMIYLD